MNTSDILIVLLVVGAMSTFAAVLAFASWDTTRNSRNKAQKTGK